MNGVQNIRIKMYKKKYNQVRLILAVFASIYLWNFFFYLGFLSRTFTHRRTAGEEAGHFFNSSPPLPPASQTIAH